MERIESPDDEARRINRLAQEMKRLHTFGHEVVQSASYEATREEYLQASDDRKWRHYTNYPPHVEHRNCG